MANKFILVPQEIYRGLTSFDTGEPNLDDVQRTLDKTRKVKEHPNAKNIHYNQELRRYLHLRNERQNRPVKVEMVASPKGAVMSSNQAHPSTEDNDDDLWMSDDISFSNYPREPLTNSYNIVPPLSESSYPPSVPSRSRSRNILTEEVSPTPLTQRQLVKRKETVNGGDKKRLKINKAIKKSKIPVKKKQKKRVTANLSLPSTSIESIITKDPDPVIESQNAPLRNSPPIDLQPSKREKEAEDFVGFKKRKGSNTTREQDRVIEKRLIAQKERKKKRWETIKKFREQTVPLDQAAMAHSRQVEKDAEAARIRRRRQRVSRMGRSPSPPIQRERLKRKYQIPEGTTLVHYKRVKGPSSKNKAKQLSKAWSKKLNILRGLKEGTKNWASRKPAQKDISLRKVKDRIISKKWASKKPTQEDINRFKPSLW
ncbi:unnamed protein product [Meloidogyne enterolobii]|uniref:Uncharacterized protein n=1 Tax=Meloidogyne enterolobii TaxID=390850 RepID=A0ACB1AKU6_MELEN